jgi:hypothetical protein
MRLCIAITRTPMADERHATGVRVRETVPTLSSNVPTKCQRGCDRSAFALRAPARHLAAAPPEFTAREGGWLLGLDSVPLAASASESRRDPAGQAESHERA